MMRISNRINERTLMFTKQYFFGEPVGTYCIELPDQIVLVDLPEYSEEIERMLQAYDLPLMCILSHGSCGIAAGTIWQKKLGLQVYLHEKDRHNEWLAMKPDVLFDTPPAFDNAIEVIHTPGHKPGSICILDKQTRSLFTGDTIGGENGKIKDLQNDPHDDDSGQRLQSCHMLLDYDFDTILPFHYEPIIGNARQRLEEYLNTLSSDMP